ncbi:uncharacterized protein LOC140707810 isoform X1 [Pogona vitticeps]
MPQKIIKKETTRSLRGIFLNMGEGMSRKKNPESGLETIRASAEEQRQVRSCVHPTMDAFIPQPTPLFRQSTWTTAGQVDFSWVSPSAHLDLDGPGRTSAGSEEDWEKNLPFEDCQEFFSEGPPLLVKVPQAEKRWECSGRDAWLESRSQDRTRSLSKGTQTEAACSHYEEWRDFQGERDPRYSVYMPEMAKRSEKAIQQGLKEFFGFLTLLMKVPTLFMVELIHFLSKVVFQGLVVDLITAIGEEMLEPLLAALLHSIFQPLMIFLLNVLSGVRDLSCPVMDILKGLSLQVAVVLKAIRLVEIHNCPETPRAEQV